MLRLAFATILVSGLAGVGPAFAETNGDSGIGRGCTLDPFTKTMRGIDFDKCTTDEKGNKVCPIVVTPTRVTAEARKAGKGQQEYMTYELKNVMVSSY